MQLKRLFLLFALLLANPTILKLSQTAASSQTISWVPLTTPQAPGGNTIALALSSSAPHILYSLIEGAQGERFFGSIDSGATWQERHVFPSVSQNDVRNLTVDPTVPTTVYANGAAGLQRSLTSGDSWETISALGDVFAAASASRLYAGGQGDSCGVNEHIFHLDRSDNGGQIWKRISLGCLYQLEQIAVLPSQPNVIYLSASHSGAQMGSLLKSIDAGQTWRTISLPFEGASAALIIDPTDPQKLFTSGIYGVLRSLDSGETWQQSSTKVMGEYFRLAFSGGSLYAVAATISRTPVYRSDDDGATWWASQNLLPAGTTALAADPSQPGLLWAGLLNYGIYLSENGGGSWSQRNTGIQTPALINAIAVSPSDGDVIYAAADAPYPAVYRTSDGGQIWGAPLLGFIDINENSSGSFLPISPHKPGSNLPIQWYPILEIRKLLVHPLNPDLAWAATSNGIYETTDGLHWQLGLSIGEAFDLAVSKAAPDQPYAALFDVQNKISYVAQRRCVTPFPCSWYENPVNTGQLSIDAIRVDPVDAPHLLSEGIVYTSDSKAVAIFESLDSGKNWQQIGVISADNTAYLSDLVNSPQNTRTLIASLTDVQHSIGQIFRSINGGVIWELWSTGLPFSFDWDEKLPLAMDELSSVYLGTSNGVYQRLSDQSLWAAIGLQGFSVRSLIYRPGASPVLLATGKDGIWRLDLPPVRLSWLPFVGD